MARLIALCVAIDTHLRGVSTQQVFVDAKGAIVHGSVMKSNVSAAQAAATAGTAAAATGRDPHCQASVDAAVSQAVHALAGVYGFDVAQALQALNGAVQSHGGPVTCSRTYEGGCGNYEQKKLNKEFTDHEYTEAECYGECKAQADCGGFFLGTATGGKAGYCYLVRAGCTDDDNSEFDYFAMTDCYEGPICSRTYEGGCGNYNHKKLNMEFSDRAYTEAECYGKCKLEADCGGFFLGTATGHCYLVQAGCTDDDNPDFDYFAMADCHEGGTTTTSITPTTTSGAGPFCTRTYEGGCQNFASQTLNMEFSDREYTEAECYGKCKLEADCGGFFLGTATRECKLVKAGCVNDNNPAFDYFAMTDCPICTRTYEGGCQNFASQTLNMEFSDREYTEAECYGKCKLEADCGGFFLGTATRECKLVKAGCVNDNNPAFDYFAMTDCREGGTTTTSITPATTSASGSICSRTYEGGCQNFASQTLNMEFSDRPYTEDECYGKCKLEAECGGFFLGTTTRECKLVKAGCVNDNNPAFDYFAMEDCHEGPICSRTYEGGCQNYPDKTLNKEFSDRPYMEDECYGKCKLEADCGGFFLGTTNRECFLVKAGCVDDDNPAFDYFAMEDCHEGA